MATPSAVKIRVYNVGFGDCFLLTFVYPGDARHILIDFGSTAAPRHAPADFMTRVAKDIQKVCAGKLHGVVATHRHRDHISGFATEGGPGSIIAALEPDFVIQPWTEDPRAARNALTATVSRFTGSKPDEKRMRAHFLGALEDMHAIADTANEIALHRADFAGRETVKQLRFLGDDNLKNLSAVQNLIDMGRRKGASTFYVNAGMQFDRLVPGVSIRVLGPPTLKQSDTIRQMRARDPSEFWQFRAFWGLQAMGVSGEAARGPGLLFPHAERQARDRLDPNVRWFIDQAKRMRASQLLELVRDLDSVLNNTSVILLMTFGSRTLLFPGDAQIENWAFALHQKQWTRLLKRTNLYKVGHHGSRNATPKSLWAMFANKGGEQQRGRLETVCSTKSGKHGNRRAGTEVPRTPLVKALRAESDFISTEEFKKSELLVREIVISTRRKKNA